MRKHRCTTLAGAGLLAALLITTTACGTEDGDAFGPAADGSAADSGYGAGGSGGDDGSGGYYADGESGSDGYGSGANDASDGSARTAPAGTLGVTSAPQLGSVVTDAKGWTLYRFDEDSADPPTSRCSGDCARTWPPVRAGDAGVSGSIDRDLIGSVEREDGTRQLTLGGWPVYRYAQDQEPGDTAGHGVGGTWFAFAPNGGKAGEAKQQDAEPGVELRAAQNAELGQKILVDAKGRTLYRFDKDSAWPMKTRCTGACLETWKPAAPVDKNAVRGVDPELVNTFDRPDGSKQLAIDCWLLYWFTGDEQPGDVEGHGVQDVWHAVAPSGKKVTP